MKTFALFLLAGSLIVSAHAETATTAPEPKALGTIDVSLAGSLIAGRALDWTSTEECLRRSYCREAELPTALVRNKTALAGFETGTASLSILGQYELTKHGHRKLARTVATFNLSVVAGVQVHNYQAVTR